MSVLLDSDLLRRVPLDGTFDLVYLPFTPEHGVVYRDGPNAGIFVPSDGSKGWKARVTGESIRRVLDHPRLALDSDGLVIDERRVVERDLSAYRLTIGMLRRFVTDQGGTWQREGDVLVVMLAGEVVCAKELLESEWTYVTATYPPPQSPTPNS